ncbi:vacuolar protein-sorting-associated protein 37 homolog 1-like isoform X25 [Quercus robur]|uniref:vacuolar protein-sorting-associated protein 37 homolog 1-like isoform X25 n=1 Tax=Quercus robur TaxID=38942 RepID=UPI002163F014|nr:vacuolar protein-sorting-associated protein 37 homolog 1-like isoform X25 [Quercus robur]
MGKKEGEKNGGGNKVAPAPAPAEKKDDVSVTAVYKINCNCNGCVEKIEKALRHFDGVEEVKIDRDACELTVKGTNLDLTAIREKLEKEIKKKFELVSPQPKKGGGGGGGGGYKKPEKKKAEKKEEPKKPKELRDELHKETLQLARENLENEPPIMELRNQDQQPQPRPQDGSSQSWYPPSVVSSPNSSRPGTPSSASSSSFSSHRTSDRPQSPSHVSPAEAAGIIAVLKDKSVDELRKLLSDKDAYHHFLLSLDQVKIQNNSRDELRKETLQLARENLEKEPRIMELRNQCRIIRTTELAAAQEKLNELERKKEETLKFYSPQSLLQRLQDANKTEEESENLHKQLLDRDVDLGTFVQKYKKLRTTYHRRALIHLSAKTSSIG